MMERKPLSWRRLLASSALAGPFVLFLLIVGGMGVWWQAFGRTPEQPIHFPHTRHAGELGLACTFCHAFAETSTQAGAPPLSLCMSCHENIAVDRPEIQKLASYNREGQPVEWARIHNLPDFIYFSHKRHLKGGVDCVDCHGAVREMAEVIQVRPLKMGWCVACHRTYNAPQDCTTCHR